MPTTTRVALLTVGDPEQVTGGYLFHRRMAEAAARHGARVDFISIPAWPLSWAILAGPLWLGTDALRRADVAVLDSIAAAPAAPWLGGLRVPVVGMLHQPPGGMEAPLARGIQEPFDRWAWRRCRILMVASDWLADGLEAAGFSRDRLRVVPPGKDPTGNLDAAGPTLAADQGLRPGRQWRPAELRGGRAAAALCVANWLERKGILELLEALTLLPDALVTLHLVGDPDLEPRYAGRIRARLQDPALRGRVVVHGTIPPALVSALYRAVDLYVMPSFEEPYGTAWGEAMAAGLPIVGWRAGNLPYLADDGREGLLVSPGDVAGLARAIERLASSPALRARMGEAALARAAARPTWDEVAVRFFGAIEEARRGKG